MSVATDHRARGHRGGRHRQEPGPQRRVARLPGALWFSLFFGVMVLLVLIVDTAIDGSPRFDSELITNYDSIRSARRRRASGPASSARSG